MCFTTAWAPLLCFLAPVDLAPAPTPGHRSYHQTNPANCSVPSASSQTLLECSTRSERYSSPNVTRVHGLLCVHFESELQSSIYRLLPLKEVFTFGYRVSSAACYILPDWKRSRRPPNPCAHFRSFGLNSCLDRSMSELVYAILLDGGDVYINRRRARQPRGAVKPPASSAAELTFPRHGRRFRAYTRTWRRIKNPALRRSLDRGSCLVGFAKTDEYTTIAGNAVLRNKTNGCVV